MKPNGNNIKIAIQKDGKLAEGSLAILKQAGLIFEAGKGRLFASCENFPLDIIFLRDDDIPEYVRDGVCELGIVGQDVLKKGAFTLPVLALLGFGKCRLAIAAPKESGIVALQALQGKTIATSFPEITTAYLKENGVGARIISLSGSVELAPALGVADAICDLVSTGSTLKTHELVEIATIFTSEAVLISQSMEAETTTPLNPSFVRGEMTVGNESNKRDLYIRQFLQRIQSVLTASKTKYILLNAPKDKAQEIARAIPGVKSPTVLPLSDPDWVSVHSVVGEDVFWETVNKLKTLGAQGILVVPIEKMIL